MASTYSSGTTGQTIFDMAITLMGEMDDNGNTDWADTVEYRNRALNILNVLRNEVYQYSDTYKTQKKNFPGKRPVCPLMESLDDEIGIDDVMAQTVLPYGLAAHLLLDENDNMAAFFNKRYQELLKYLGANIPGEWEAIAMEYGGLEFGEFGSW